MWGTMGREGEEGGHKLQSPISTLPPSDSLLTAPFPPGDFPMDCPLQDCVVHVHMRGTLPDQGGSEFMDTRKGGEGEGEGEPLQIGTGEGRGGSEFMDTRKGEEGEGKGAGEPLQIGTGEGRVRGRAGRVEGLEASIRLMLPGEVALVSSTAQFAYDSFPRPDGVPEGARVQWEVELFGFERPKVSA
ncbi:unnamed protein product [Closterium sp. NIES-53]